MHLVSKLAMQINGGKIRKLGHHHHHHYNQNLLMK